MTVRKEKEKSFVSAIVFVAYMVSFFAIPAFAAPKQAPGGGQPPVMAPMPQSQPDQESPKMPAVMSGDVPAGSIKSSTPTKSPSQMMGAKITMSFTSAPVGYILQSLGRMFNISFSISSSAAAKTVSLELNDVTFEEAMTMIADASQIDIAKQGEHLYVAKATAERKETESEKQRELREQTERIQNGVMEVVTVRNVEVEDVRGALEKTFGEESDKVVTVSKVATDEKRQYNSVLVYAANQKILNSVKDMIRSIDVDQPMVEIEVLFMEISTNNTKDLGVNWNVMTDPLKFAEANPGSLPGNGIQIGGETVEANVVDNFTTARFGQFWRLSPWQAEATVTALASSGRGRVLANPRLRVKSGRKASFASETQVPILTKDSDGDINTEWKNVGIGLDIQPVVLSKNSEINLKVTPKVSSITGEKKLGDVVAPIIAERKADTEVILNPEETMVIGGLMNDKDIRSMSKVPILGDIPLFGELFRSRKTEKEKSTVVVFLRPHLVYVNEREGKGDPVLTDENVKGLWKGKPSTGIQGVPASNLNATTENGKRYTDSEYRDRFNDLTRKYESNPGKATVSASAIESKSQVKNESKQEQKSETKPEKDTVAKNESAPKNVEKKNSEKPGKDDSGSGKKGDQSGEGQSKNDEWTPPME